MQQRPGDGEQCEGTAQRNRTAAGREDGSGEWVLCALALRVVIFELGGCLDHGNAPAYHSPCREHLLLLCPAKLNSSSDGLGEPEG